MFVGWSKKREKKTPRPLLRRGGAFSPPALVGVVLGDVFIEGCDLAAKDNVDPRRTQLQGSQRHADVDVDIAVSVDFRPHRARKHDSFAGNVSQFFGGVADCVRAVDDQNFVFEKRDHTHTDSGSHVQAVLGTGHFDGRFDHESGPSLHPFEDVCLDGEVKTMVVFGCSVYLCGTATAFNHANFHFVGLPLVTQ